MENRIKLRLLPLFAALNTVNLLYTSNYKWLVNSYKQMGATLVLVILFRYFLKKHLHESLLQIVLSTFFWVF